MTVVAVALVTASALIQAAEEVSLPEVLDQAPVAIAILRDHDLVLVNQHFLTLIGQSPDQVIRADDLSNCGWHHRLRQLLDARAHAHIETQWQHSNGTIIPVAIQTTASDAQTLIISVQDLSAQKATTTALEERNRFISSLLTAIPAAVFYKDRQGRYIGCNQAFSDIMGVDEQQLAGRTVGELWPSDLADIYHQADLDLMEQGGHQIYVSEVVGADGRRRPVIFGKQVFHDAHGEVAGIVGAFVDISEQQRLISRARWMNLVLSLLLLLLIVALLALIRTMQRRRQAEAQLRLKTDQMEAFFATAPDLLCIADTAGCFVRVNRRWEEVLGHPAESLSGRSFLDFVHPDDRTATQQAMAQLDTQDPVLGFVNRYRCHDGSYRHIEWHSVPVGQLIYACARDITQRRQAEERLRASEERYRCLIENMTAGFALHEMIYDADGEPCDYRYLEVNPAFEHMTGTTAAALIGHTISEVMPNTEDYWIRTFGRVAKTGEPTSYQNYAREIGRHFDVWVYAPAPDTFAVMCLDITDRVEAHEALRAKEEHLRVTLDSIGDAVITTDTEGRVTAMNPIAERLTGWPEDEAQGRHLPEVFRIINARTRAMVEDPAAKVLASGEIVGLANHTMLLARDGSEYHIADSGAPIRDHSGTIRGVVLVFRDVSEEYALRERLQQSQKLDALGHLAGGVAHDFNNMLTGILGGAELLHRRLGDDATNAGHITMIIEAAERAAGLTRQLLSFSRQRPLDMRPIDLHQAINNAVALLRNTIDRRIIIDRDLESGPALVDGDLSLLQSVLLNLGINAAHAMPDGGTLSIRSRRQEINDYDIAQRGLDLTPGPYYVISVIDTGTGIDPLIRDKIFDPFFTTKTSDQGTGLGLAVALGTIRQHEGALEVDSCPGEGTTITLLLPVTEQASQTQPTLPTPAVGSGTILVVDDEEMMRTIAATMLQQLGYQVCTARNGAEALAYLEETDQSCDLILLDMMMPVMNGAECLAALRASGHSVPVLLCTGYSAQEQMDDIGTHDIAGIVPKPYRMADLGEAVAAALRGENR